MPVLVWAILVGAGLLGAVGVGLLVMAWRGGSGWFGARAPVVGVSGGRCRGCGYCTDGLEDPICPECGALFEMGVRRMERHRRVAAGVGGGLLVGVAALGLPVSDAAEHGLAHAAPTAALLAALRAYPEWMGAIGPELRARSDARLLRGWERRELARVCDHMLEGASSAPERREAAGLLAEVGESATDAIVMRMLRDPDVRVRSEGVRGACAGASRGRVVSAWIRKRLVTLASADPSPTVRKAAVDSMRVLGNDEQGRAALAAAMADPNEGVRRRALIGLATGESDERSAALAALRASADSSEEVRRLATWALARVAERPSAAAGMGGVVAVLTQMAMGDEDEEVRRAAMDAIRSIRATTSSV